MLDLQNHYSTKDSISFRPFSTFDKVQSSLKNMSIWMLIAVKAFVYSMHHNKLCDIINDEKAVNAIY